MWIFFATGWLNFACFTFISMLEFPIGNDWPGYPEHLVAYNLCYPEKSISNLTCCLCDPVCIYQGSYCINYW